MKRPEMIVKWFHVERERDGIWVDWSGKPKDRYFVEIPYWLIRAFKPSHVKVEITKNIPSFAKMQEEENGVEVQKYFKENWSKKVTKMRNLNHGYLLVATTGVCRNGFKSIEDYENYHKELRVLNKKYLGETKP